MTTDDLTQRLTPVVAQRILAGAGIDEPMTVALVRTHNHVWRLHTEGRQGQTFYLKTHTKDWYAGDPTAPGKCVTHEAAAYGVLAQHGLATPEVVVAELGSDNPFGRPFLLTRGLAGMPLTDCLRVAEPGAFADVLRAVGAYMGRTHAIRFPFPGYIMGLDGPDAHPAAGPWQHGIWTAHARQEQALATLDAHADALPPGLVEAVRWRLSTIVEAMGSAYEPPRFVHGDCHAHQFFVSPTGTGGAAPRVHGVVDMEVASAGDAVQDLVKFSIEAAAALPATSRWWGPLFAGYGAEPDFELFRLRLLGTGPPSFACVRPAGEQPTWEHVLRHLLDARDWGELLSGGW
jgi:aminoglycoside phosphotransferase (APT) family kinase protein